MEARRRRYGRAGTTGCARKWVKIGGNKQEGGGRAEPPKKPAQSGAVKNTGVQQGGTKSDPATQLTGKVWLGGKNRGRRKRRSRTQKMRAEIRPWRKNRVLENGDLGAKIAGQKKLWRSGRRAPEIGYLGVKIAGQKKMRRSGRRVPESGYLGVKIAGQKRRGGAGEGYRKMDTWASKIAGQKKTWRSGRWVAKREQTCREKEQSDLAARSEQQKKKKQRMIRNHRPKKQPSSLRSWGNTDQKKRSRRPASGKTLEVKYCKIHWG